MKKKIIQNRYLTEGMFSKMIKFGLTQNQIESIHPFNWDKYKHYKITIKEIKK